MPRYLIIPVLLLAVVSCAPEAANNSASGNDAGGRFVGCSHGGELTPCEERFLGCFNGHELTPCDGTAWKADK
jgi:hypothetical protein